jgi:hypothetical protein
MAMEKLMKQTLFSENQGRDGKSQLKNESPFRAGKPF